MREVELGEVCDLKNGFAFKSSDYIECSNTLSCRMSNIRPGGEFDINYNARFLPDDFSQKYKEYLLHDNDIVIAMTDLASSPKILGVPTIIKTYGKSLLLNQRVGKLVIKDNSRVYFPFLKYALNWPKIRSCYQKFASGGLQINLGKRDLLSVQIPLPPLEEQKRIAAILDQADRLRGLRQRAIDRLNELGQAIFYEMFGDWDKGSSEFPLVLLGESIDFLTSGSRGWAQYYSDTGAKFIRIQNVKRGQFSEYDLAFVNAPNTAEANRTRVKTGDVLLSITADLGRSAVVPEEIGEAYINQHLALVRTSTFNPYFLVAAISSHAGERTIAKKNKTGVKAGLNFDDIRTLKIITPPMKIQDEFVQRQKQVVHQLGLQLDLKQMHNDLFYSLQQRAFRGDL